MLDRDSSHFFGPTRALNHEGPEAMQAFVSRHRAFLILVVVLVAQLLLLSVQTTRNQNVRLIQVWAVRVFDPFERSVHWTVSKTAGTWRNFSGLWGAQKQNQELNRELASARTQILQLSQQVSEADRLRALLDFKNQAPFQSVAAEVIASSPGERSNAVFIGKGSDAGFSPDLAVITPEGVVGKIIAVFPHSAQVLLITDSSSGVGCILEKTRVQGVLKGTGQNFGQLHYIMNDQPVSVGDVILTSGLDQIYPKGLPVGTVTRTSPGNIYKDILIAPAAALDRLETVLVVPKTAAQEQVPVKNGPPSH
jgi:rod shape-determining protein MreC